jgi:hypothetical protein
VALVLFEALRQQGFGGDIAGATRSAANTRPARE